jgi:hypothetical protein
VVLDREVRVLEADVQRPAAALAVMQLGGAWLRISDAIWRSQAGSSCSADCVR